MFSFFEVYFNADACKVFSSPLSFNKKVALFWKPLPQYIIVNAIGSCVMMSPLTSMITKSIKSKGKRPLKYEADVRYCICNPLISIACDVHGYFLCVEETISDKFEVKEEECDDAALNDIGELFWPEILSEEVPQSSSALQYDSSRPSIGGAMSNTVHNGMFRRDDCSLIREMNNLKVQSCHC